MNSTGHIPVLLKEITDFAKTAAAVAGENGLRYFDGTFGRGGHLKAILDENPRSVAVAFDQDPEAVAFAGSQFSSLIEQKRLMIEHKNFVHFDPQQWEPFDFMLIDLGVSSPQLDEHHRGFSFYHDGPLDMRMDPSQATTAADIVAEYSEEELNELFKNFGEIQRPYRVTRAIVHDRKSTPFTSTRQLAGLIERVEGWRKKGFHPATQFFMALRLVVNRELEVVEQSIEKLVLGLKSKGLLAVLTFHSLEDRIVKNKFKELANDRDLGLIVNKKVIIASREESEANPRSRSAKLRVFQRS
jgi:16S rRNA (cytosine1402-N4)-methyltransferase